MRSIDVSDEIDKARFGRFQWSVVALCAILHVVDDYDVFVAGTVLPTLIKEQHLWVDGQGAGQGARAGSASAMLGCLQFSVAAGAASLVGVLHDGSAMPESDCVRTRGESLMVWS